jgi:hypothetical protein
MASMLLANLIAIRTRPGTANSPAYLMSGFCFEDGTTLVTSHVVDVGFYTSIS